MLLSKAKTHWLNFSMGHVVNTYDNVDLPVFCFNSNLLWNNHITGLCNKLCRVFYALHKLVSCVSPNALKIFLIACFTAIYWTMFISGGILQTQLKFSDYRNMHYIYWIRNPTLNIVKYIYLTSHFNFSQSWLVLYILHYKMINFSYCFNIKLKPGNV